MKVSQEKQFTPITITLETQEEAEWMWAALFMSGNKIKEYNSTAQTSREPSIHTLRNETLTNMWSSFNKMYHD